MQLKALMGLKSLLQNQKEKKKQLSLKNPLPRVRKSEEEYSVNLLASCSTEGLGFLQSPR